jgi:hypothetical protein
MVKTPGETLKRVQVLRKPVNHSRFLTALMLKNYPSHLKQIFCLP